MLQNLTFEIKGGQRVGVGTFTQMTYRLQLLMHADRDSRSDWSRQIEPNARLAALHPHRGLSGLRWHPDRFDYSRLLAVQRHHNSAGRAYHHFYNPLTLSDNVGSRNSWAVPFATTWIHSANMTTLL